MDRSPNDELHDSAKKYYATSEGYWLILVRFFGNISRGISNNVKQWHRDCIWGESEFSRILVRPLLDTHVQIFWRCIFRGTEQHSETRRNQLEWQVGAILTPGQLEIV